MNLIQDTSLNIEFVSAYGQLPFCNTYLKHVFYINVFEATTPIYLWFYMHYYILHNNYARFIFFFLMRIFMLQESHSHYM